MMKGISAVIATILMLMITIALAGMAYMYISGIYSAKTGVVVRIDETRTSCVAGTVTVYLKNEGTLSVAANSITVTGTRPDGTTSMGSGSCAASGNILPGNTTGFQCTTSLTSTSGTGTLRVSGAGGSTTGTVLCP
jgi:flagellin-like protein